MRQPQPTGTSTLPAITISMVGDQVVIRPDGRLDHEATVAFAAALDSAVSAETTGSTVVVDLGDTDGLGSPAAPHAAALVVVDPEDGGSPVPVEVVVTSAGFVRVAAVNSWWTIDVNRRRFCRSAAPVDHRFVEDSAWTRLRRLWLSPRSVTALTSADSLITSSRKHREPTSHPSASGPGC